MDREGEAIAWHLKEALGIPDERVKRVIFNAITKAEIQKAFKSPIKLDMDRVNAQQARRILDRIVGWEVSRSCGGRLAKQWQDAQRGSRAIGGTVRLVVEREREIEAFVPSEYWTIGGIFTAAVRRQDELMQKWTDFHRRW